MSKDYPSLDSCCGLVAGAGSGDAGDVPPVGAECPKYVWIYSTKMWSGETIGDAEPVASVITLDRASVRLSSRSPVADEEPGLGCVG